MKQKSGTLVRTITGIALLFFLVSSILLGKETMLCFFQ